jgi:MOSC domain-containing protein YiiM
MSGKVEAIWSKRARGGVMDSTNQATLVEGEGLVGDANFGATRHVTVIEKEVVDRIRSELSDFDPKMRRANIMVSGIRLEDSRDKVLTIGEVKIRLRGETRPCELMDEQCPGLREALDLHWHGGAHGSVIQGGEIRVGDGAAIEAAVPVG